MSPCNPESRSPPRQHLPPDAIYQLRLTCSKPNIRSWKHGIVMLLSLYVSGNTGRERRQGRLLEDEVSCGPPPPVLSLLELNDKDVHVFIGHIRVLLTEDKRSHNCPNGFSPRPFYHYGGVPLRMKLQSLAWHDGSYLNPTSVVLAGASDLRRCFWNLCWHRSAFRGLDPAELPA